MKALNQADSTVNNVVSVLTMNRTESLVLGSRGLDDEVMHVCRMRGGWCNGGCKC